MILEIIFKFNSLTDRSVYFSPAYQLYLSSQPSTLSFGRMLESYLDCFSIYIVLGKSQQGYKP